MGYSLNNCIEVRRSAGAPRNLLMAEVAAEDLAGGAVGVWYAPNITSDLNVGIGGWSVDELVRYMKTGNIAKGQASGPMAEAIDHSLQYMTDADLRAMAVYLKAVPAVADPDVKKPVYDWAGAEQQAPVRIRGAAWSDDIDQLNGARHRPVAHRQLGNGHSARDRAGLVPRSKRARQSFLWRLTDSGR